MTEKSESSLSMLSQAVSSGVEDCRTTINEGPASLNLHFASTGCVHLTDFEVEKEKRRARHGTRLLRSVVEWADRHHISLSLVASPADQSMPVSKLMSFYRRFGFIARGAYADDAVPMRRPKVKRIRS